MVDQAIIQCHFDPKLVLLNCKFKLYILNLKGQFFEGDSAGRQPLQNYLNFNKEFVSLSYA